jgi:hypothetical protein
MIQQPLPFVNNCTDIRKWDSACDDPKFLQNFVIGNHVTASTHQEIISIIHLYWDCFYSKGVHNSVLGFEFCIDTGGSAPVCCHKPHYGPHKGTIIMSHIKVLLHNGWIQPCNGHWGSSVVLATKPHQEHITDIQDFVWRMCVSYHCLNTVTLPFEYSIPCCNNAINNFGDSAGRLFSISLDNKTDYHQILVWA